MAELTKKQIAADFFDKMIDKREAGEFESNKAFRKACIEGFQKELGVSGSSACTMYNTNKKRVTDEDPTIGLGRDPSKPKTKSAVIKKAAKAKGLKVKDLKGSDAIDPVAMVGMPAVDEDDILDRKVVNDTSVAVDLDPIESLSDGFGDDDISDLLDGMGYNSDEY